jgi:segregation and condensation protein A
VSDSAQPEASDWEDRPRAAAGMAPILSVEGFEGPRDWLLEMTRARKIDIMKLSILALVDSFVTALEEALAPRAGVVPELARWGDWLVMASNLTLLRSRLLLPADRQEAEAAAEEAAALRRHMVSRAQASAGADWLERRPQLGREVFARGFSDAPMAGRAGDITELLRACLVALRLPEGTEPYRPLPPPVWRMGDALAHIRMLLARLPAEGRPLAAFLPAINHAVPQKEFLCRAALATTFLAGLELSREGVVALDQDAAWRPVQLHPAKPDID